MQRRWTGMRVSNLISPSQIAPLIFGNRRRSATWAGQPALRGWTLKGRWLPAQPKHGGPGRSATQWVRWISLSATIFFLPDVFLLSATAAATADIVGAARLLGTFGTNFAEQNTTTTAIAWVRRGAWCASPLAGEAHERG